MESYNDGYEKGDPQFDMIIQSSEWAYKQSQDLLKQYKNCRTKLCKKKILPKLKSAWQKMDYEDKTLENIIQKAKEDGII